MEITFYLTEKLEKIIAQEPASEHVLDEFKDYKRRSLDYDDLPTPSRDSQSEYQSISDTMGRDRRFEAPYLAKQVDLHHIHVWQDGSRWEGGLAQWECTSNSYLIYSWVIRDDRHHILVMDYFRDNAHNIYAEENSQVIELWASQAKAFWQDL
ncbi:type II toxin-antitoxin system YafO family toxin [Aeromonas media]